MSREEHRIQVSIARYLKVALTENTIFFAVPNGGHLVAKEKTTAAGKRKRFSAAAVKLKAEGQTNGVADLIVIDQDPFPGGGSRVIGLEVKTARGRQSRDQKTWAQNASLAGVRYYIVRSIEDVAAALEREGVTLRARPSTVPGRLYDAGNCQGAEYRGHTGIRTRKPGARYRNKAA